ncbi:MAG TPA: hypothetical protein VHY91_06345 [Pirellulales bacterium]|jgi:hypothetical protein|nr:hypothetical protein [Pirellulales bacterium]
MNIVLTSGILAISIDLELDVQRRGSDHGRSLETVGRQLAELLAQYRLPATWAVADPAVSAATDRILATDPAHEIAILGDRTWVGPGADRPRFARELTRRATRGRTAGLAISTLLLRGTELDNHLDLAVKQGITAVAQTEAAPGTKWFARTRPEIAPLRFGLWQLPTQLALPCQRDWRVWRSPARQARTELARVIAQHEVFHLSISGLAAAEASRSTLRSLDRLLLDVARGREAGQLVVETVAATARRLSGGRQSTPARSILQPAA